MDFPSSPTLNQTYTQGLKTWKWNGIGWELVIENGGDAAAWGSIEGSLEDQADLVAELALKADVASLATVATSGSYNDLTDTPAAGVGNSQIDIENGAYTFVAGDKGRTKAKNVTTAYTYTLNNGVFEDGDFFYVANFANTQSITIARGSGVTLYLAGSTVNANRTVGPRGFATVFMESPSVGYVFGVGVG